LDQQIHLPFVTYAPGSPVAIDEMLEFSARHSIAPITETFPMSKVNDAYEWHEDSGNWFRSYANENWEFDDGIT
jgi:D-arabinose 1-dehydrogenase-like Zn-dependent alcohol dehydrogenase